MNHNKLSPIDEQALQKWDDYTEVKEAIFFYTDTADAPWVVVKSDDKKHARLNCIHHFLASLCYPNKDPHIVRGADPLIVVNASSVIVEDKHILVKARHPQHNQCNVKNRDRPTA